MLWVGLMVGLFFGTWFGVFITALVSSGNPDRRGGYLHDRPADGSDFGKTRLRP